MSEKPQKRIYLDYMASTPLDKRVYDAMEPFWSDIYGHPWSIHKDGIEANTAANSALDSFTSFINAKSDELFFTSGGTESTTQAIKGLLEFIEESNGTLKGLHVVISRIEHPSVYGMIEFAKYKEMDVTVVDVEENGIVNLEGVREALRPETVLVSIMYVNSEIGTIQPIQEISKIIKRHRKDIKNKFELPNLDFEFPAFHTDASQAALYLDCDVEMLGVDMMTLDAHKIYGPKGIGSLYVRNGLLLKPLLFGPEKKKYLRHGTPPVPLIVGFAKAYEVVLLGREESSKRVTELRDYFIKKVEEEIPEAKLNGDRELRAPQNASFSFDNVNHEFLAVQLDELGISVSTRSACSSKNTDSSRILEAIHNHREPSAIRFSVGKETTKEELDITVEALKKSLNIT